MIMNTRLLGCALLAWIICLPGCSKSEIKFPPPPRTLNVKVIPPQTTYSLKQYEKYDYHELTNAFLVRFQVTNPDPTPGTIWVMSCSYNGHWETDNKEVSIGGWGCDGNAPIGIILSLRGANTNINGWPHRVDTAYTDDLPLLINPTAKGKDLAFRIAFTPLTGPNIPPGRINPPLKTYWSDKITLKVTD